MNVEVTLRDTIRRQQEFVRDFLDAMKEHHVELGNVPFEQCPTCTFWSERYEQLRRQARRAGV